jgi:hypothetical protein
MSKDTQAVRKPERGKIDLTDKAQAKFWARELDVSLPELARLVEKAGDSAAAVRKELGHSTRVRDSGGSHAPGSKANG